MGTQVKSQAVKKPTSVIQEVDGERYNTDLSWLLASDSAAGVFLFRALNSNYFVQRSDKEDKLQVLSAADAEELYNRLPSKHEGIVSAFPQRHGGVGMNTVSRYD